MKSSALCGLGQTAPNPVLSTLRYFRDEYEAHMVEKRCPAGVCKNCAIQYILDRREVQGLHLCARTAPPAPSPAPSARPTSSTSPSASSAAPVWTTAALAPFPRVKGGKDKMEQKMVNLTINGIPSP